MDGYRYVVLGAGRQGVAAAYDLALHGGAREVTLADASEAQARRAAEWLRERLPRDGAAAVVPVTVDAGDDLALAGVLRGASAAVSALPYRYNLAATRAAVGAGCSLCDLGGHTDTVRAQLALDAPARAAGVSVVPDCGQAPGMATSLMVLALGMVADPVSLEVWDGGLPLDPAPPLHYRLTFAVQGLTNEYDGPCYAIRGGEVVALDSLTEVQTVDFPPPLGRLDAFCASGTASTFPWTFQGRLREFTSRIVRHPGHLAAITTLKQLGFFSQQPLDVDGCRVAPRRLTEELLAPLLVGDGPVRDVVVVRVHCRGADGGRAVRAEVDAVVPDDLATGLTAMQRCTGFDAAIVAAMLARGEVAGGVAVRELSVSPARYVEELARRDMRVASRVVPDEPAERLSHRP